MTSPLTRLGRTGLRVSRLCLGTMTFGLQTNEAEARAILDKASDAGVNFIDTADVYPLGGDLQTVGRTEDIVGRWLNQGTGQRHNYVLATKAVGRIGSNPWDPGSVAQTPARSYRRFVETSRHRLRRPVSLHSDDAATPLEETVSALNR